MGTNLRLKLTFHGAVVVLLGLAAGFPYALVQLGSLSGESRAWSMAHLEGVLNGLLLLAVAGVMRRLTLDSRKQSVLAWSLIVMAYGNVIAAALAATFGVRGLEPTGPFVNVLVSVLFLIAVVGVVVGMGLVAYGALPGKDVSIQRITVDVRTDEAASSTGSDGPGGDPGSDRTGNRAARRRKRGRADVPNPE